MRLPRSIRLHVPLCPLWFILPFSGLSVFAAEPPPLTVFAAASLKEGLESLAARFEAEGNGPIRISADASGVLARQIEHGAPADVFLSADRAWIDYLASRDLLDTTTRRTVLRNRLVVVTRPDATWTMDRAEDLTRAARVAIGDPATVPAGRYAKQFLERHDLWTRLEGRLLFAVNVEAALAFVQRGEAEGALVYASDARASRGVNTAFAVDEGDHDPIMYEAAVLKDAPRRVAALKFFWLLETPEAKALFEKGGFTLP